MRIVFMGSAPLSCVCLETLIRACPGEVAGIVCQPDRPRGRSLRTCPCPVKDRAAGMGLPVLTPDNVNAPEAVGALRALQPDLVVVVAYGQILRRALLDLPPCGCLNIHASLLPKYRGAAPIQWAVARGERLSGVTAMFMNERMDAGDIVLQRPVPIGPEDTAVDVYDAMGREGAAALVEAAEQIRRGTVSRVAQVEADATYAPKLRREDGRIDWTIQAAEIHNRIRGFQPWPACFTAAPARRAGPAPELKIWRSRAEPLAVAGPAAAPGTVAELGAEGPLVASGGGAVRLLSVQPEGKKIMSAGDYVRGYGLRAGDRFGVPRAEA